jgi:Asp-tRNA(Asn)/Glu-tRNA(Gln) amidotransferase A subunit family amidase
MNETRDTTEQALSQAHDGISRTHQQLVAVVTGEARQADEEIAAGWYRGPLHGIP